MSNPRGKPANRNRRTMVKSERSTDVFLSNTSTTMQIQGERTRLEYVWPRSGSDKDAQNWHATHMLQKPEENHIGHGKAPPRLTARLYTGQYVRRARVQSRRKSTTFTEPLLVLAKLWWDYISSWLGVLVEILRQSWFWLISTTAHSSARCMQFNCSGFKRGKILDAAVTHFLTYNCCRLSSQRFFFVILLRFLRQRKSSYWEK